MVDVDDLPGYVTDNAKKADVRSAIILLICMGW
jgi:hypothetical protein